MVGRAEAGYQGHLYLIVSLAVEPHDARLYMLVDGEFLELSFVALEK